MPGMESINTTANGAINNANTAEATEWDNMDPSAEAQAQTETPAETSYENEFGIAPEVAAQQEAMERADFNQYVETMNSEQDVISGNDMAVTAETITNVDAATPEDNNDIDPEIAANLEAMEQAELRQYAETSAAEEQAANQGAAEVATETTVSETTDQPAENTPAEEAPKVTPLTAEEIQKYREITDAKKALPLVYVPRDENGNEDFANLDSSDIEGVRSIIAGEEARLLRNQQLRSENLENINNHINYLTGKHEKAPAESDDAAEIDSELKVYIKAQREFTNNSTEYDITKVFNNIENYYNDLAGKMQEEGLPEAVAKLQNMASVTHKVSEEYNNPIPDSETTNADITPVGVAAETNPQPVSPQPGITTNTRTSSQFNTTLPGDVIS